MKSLGALFLLVCAPLLAAPTSVGIVDVAQVMNKYNKAIEIKASIDKSVEVSRAAINDRRTELDQLKTDLDSSIKRTQDPLLNESGKKSAQAEAQTKAQNFQQRVNDFEQFVKNAQGQIQQRATELEQNVIADIRQEAEKISKEKNIQVVLPKSMTFVSDSSLDITDAIISNLNASYKSTNPAGSGDQPAEKK